MRLRRLDNGGRAAVRPARRRSRRVAVALLAALATAGTAAMAAGSSGTVTARQVATPANPATAPIGAPTSGRSCTVQPLRAIGGRHGNATAVSSNGLVAGIASDQTGASFPVLWRAAHQPVRIPARLYGAVPTGVNRHGVVIGTAYRMGADIPVGWWWAGRDVHALPVARGEVAIPEAINDAGQVVGAVVNDEEHAERETVDDVERAAFWPSVHQLPRTLGPLAGDEGGHAYAVSSRGAVGGISSGVTFRPVVWDGHGRPSVLRTGGSRAGAVQGFARDGSPVGEAVLPGRGMGAVRWDRTGTPHSLASIRALGAVKFGATVMSGLRRSAQPGARAVDAVAVAANGTLLVGYTVSRDGSRFPARWRCR